MPDFRTGRSHGGLLYLPEAAPHFIRREKTDDLDRLFTEKTFWIGQDNCQIKNTLELLFRELKEQKTGYTVYVETLLRQLIVQMIRNYQAEKKPSTT